MRRKRPGRAADRNRNHPAADRISGADADTRAIPDRIAAVPNRHFRTDADFDARAAAAIPSDRLADSDSRSAHAIPDA